MNELDKVKASALKKLDEYVKCELRYLVDNNLPIGEFSIEDSMCYDSLSEEEGKEVEASLEQLRTGHVLFYCRCRGIEVPEKLLKKVDKKLIAESENDADKKKEEKKLLTSKTDAKAGRQILCD